jgi:F-type H+-transporting ATPase subunit epsilon
MPTIKLEIVTAERQVFSDEVTSIIVEGAAGEMTILPKHSPLMTSLVPGPLLIRRDGDEICMAISGGFMEVRPDKIIILADACERSDEIDAERALAAKQKAEEALKNIHTTVDHALVDAALRRSLARLRVIEKQRKSPGYRPNR